MRFTIGFGRLPVTLCLCAALLLGSMTAATTVVDVSPVPETARINTTALNLTAPPAMTHAKLLHWLATTTANITFVGKPISPLADPAKLAADAAVSVVFCTTVSGYDCGGSCWVYNGDNSASAVCIEAQGINCLGATTDVFFCASGDCGCDPGCNVLSSCGTPLNGGYCYTPGTNSIVVPQG